VVHDLGAGLTTFAVFKPISPANGARIFHFQCSEFDDFGFACDTTNNTANAVVYNFPNGNQESVEGYNDMSNGAQEYTVRQYGATSLQIYNSGALVGLAVPISFGDVSNGGDIGKGSVGPLFSGDVAEILTYNRPLSDSERTQVELYLANKYDLYYPGVSWISNYSLAVQSRIISNRWDKGLADAYVAAQTSLRNSNPGMLTQGLAVWLKADAGVTSSSGSVSQWIDQVNGNALIQSTAANQPQYVAADQNGIPGIRFDGQDDLSASQSNGLGFTLKSNITVITVGMTTAPSQIQNSVCLGLYPNGEQGRFMGYSNSLEAFNYNSGGAAPSSGVFTIETASYNSSLSEVAFSQNGISTSVEQVASGFGALGPGIYVGAAPFLSMNQGWQGDISEILVYDHVLSTSELQQVSSYLAGRYGIISGGYSYPAPSISPDGSVSSSNISVSFSNAPGSTTIHYTLDGTSPTASSPLYSGAFTISASCPVKCALFQGTTEASTINTAQFYIGDSGDIGISDAWQMEYFGHTGIDANAQSPGGSGLTNLQAYLYGYNPNLYSTNGDGLSDFVNHLLGYSATDTDINGYGLTNAQQLALGLDPFNLNFTPPPAPPTPDPNDHTPPTVTLTTPQGATLVP